MQVKQLIKILAKRPPDQYVAIILERCHIQNREEFDLEYIGGYNRSESGDWFGVIPEDSRDKALIFGFSYYDGKEQYEDENADSDVWEIL